MGDAAVPCNVEATPSHQKFTARIRPGGEEVEGEVAVVLAGVLVVMVAAAVEIAGAVVGVGVGVAATSISFCI